jgi:hypothetical protein
MSNAVIIPCDCCNEAVDVADSLLDAETEMITCPECHKFLIAAKAQLARPFDEKGHKIALKGIHKRT